MCSVKLVAFAAVAVVGLLLLQPAAIAAKRVALVVGNGAYENTQRLENPANDAALLTHSLLKLGFEVVPVSNGSHRDMLDAMSEFGRKAEEADVALFFFAGHGLEVAGRNWILPIDADIESSSDLPASAVKVDDVLEVMELSQARIRLVILDACRNNPLPRSLARSTGRGLAKIDASAAGTMVVFAAAPGEVALDGSGANSPFSASLANHITERGLEVRQMIGRVRQDVMAATNAKQVPWVNEAIAGDFYLAGLGAEGSSAVTPQATAAPGVVVDQHLSVELKFWDSVKDSRSKQMLQLYLDKYPDGAFHELAEAMIAGLEDEVSAPRAAPKSETVSPQNSQDRLAALQSDMENRSRNFVADFNAAFSSDLDYALSFARSAYSRSVDFYGKRFSLQEVLRDKERLIKRWPQRSYRSPDNEVSAYCNPATRRCNVEAIVYWNVYSPKRNQRANGAQRTTFVLDFSSGQPFIVQELGENVTQ